MRDIVETCDVTRNEAGGPQENLNATEGNDDLTIVTTENGLGTAIKRKAKICPQRLPLSILGMGRII